MLIGRKAATRRPIHVIVCLLELHRNFTFTGPELYHRRRTVCCTTTVSATKERPDAYLNILHQDAYGGHSLERPWVFGRPEGSPCVIAWYRSGTGVLYCGGVIGKWTNVYCISC
jgi:hypothetical protein